VNKKRKFPIFSLLGLVYAIIATISALNFSNNINVALGYGITNLSYVLIIATIINGKFGVFKLQKRSHTFGLAVALFIVGVVLSNIY
jgi:hypothetical protein